MQSMQDVLQEKCSSYSPMIDRRIQKHEDCVSLDQESLMHKGLGVGMAHSLVLILSSS